MGSEKALEELSIGEDYDIGLLASGGIAKKEQDIKKRLFRKISCTIIAVIVALCSFTFVADYMSSPETHAASIATLDEKRANVTGLVGASAAASFAVSLIPDDAGTAISEQLADLSADFAIIIAVITFEKYLLTIMGLISFKVLIPTACAMFVFDQWVPRLGQRLRSLAVRIAALGVVLCFVVPASVYLSNVIDDTYDTSYSISAAMEASEQESNVVSDEAAEDEGLFEKIWNFPGNAVDSVVGMATGAVDSAVEAFNSLLEAFAIMMITACVIPVVVLILAIWLVGAILGVNTSKQIDAITGRSWRVPIREKRRQVVNAVNSAKETE